MAEGKNFCKDCKYFNDKDSTCHYSPPVLSIYALNGYYKAKSYSNKIDTDKNLLNLFPIIHDPETCWCGRWSRSNWT